MPTIVTQLNHRLLQQTFEIVKPRADVLTKQFFQRLLAEHPRLKRLFGRVNIEELRPKLIQSLVLIVKWLETPDRLTRYLHELGARHVDYRVGPEDYETFVETFVMVLGETIGASWDRECEFAWRDALRAVTDTMLEGLCTVNRQPAEKLSPSKAIRPTHLNGNGNENLPRWKRPTPALAPSDWNEVNRADAVSAHFTTVNRTNEGSNERQAVAGITQSTRGTLDAVFASVAQLSASVDEIGRCISAASNTSERAGCETDGASMAIAQLREVSSQVGQTIDAIASMADETSFLALNGTIEALRAGQAGEGFAAIAQSIKELARQTITATEEIRLKFQRIQDSSDVALLAIGAVGNTIHRINEITLTITEAIDVHVAANRNLSQTLAEPVRRAGDALGLLVSVQEVVPTTCHRTLEIFVAADSCG